MHTIGVKRQKLDSKTQGRETQLKQDIKEQPTWKSFDLSKRNPFSPNQNARKWETLISWNIVWYPAKSWYRGEFVACIANEHASFTYSSIPNCDTLDEPWSCCSHWSWIGPNTRTTKQEQQLLTKGVFWLNLSDSLRERKRVSECVCVWRHFTWFCCPFLFWNTLYHLLFLVALFFGFGDIKFHS